MNIMLKNSKLMLFGLMLPVSNVICMNPGPYDIPFDTMRLPFLEMRKPTKEEQAAFVRDITERGKRFEEMQRLIAKKDPETLRRIEIAAEKLRIQEAEKLRIQAEHWRLGFEIDTDLSPITMSDLKMPSWDKKD